MTRQIIDDYLDMEAVQKRLGDLLEIPFDTSKIKWEQLWSFSEFKWVHGETPFSHLQFNIFMAVFYVASVYLLKVFHKIFLKPESFF